MCVQIMNNQIRIIQLTSMLWLFSATMCLAEYLPTKVEKITKQQSTYLTPENTLSAVKSALKSGDLEWGDLGVSQETLEDEIRLFNEAGAERSVNIELEKQVRETFIVDKVTYKDDIILVIEDYGYSGSIKRYPVTFTMEDGLWRITNKFSTEEFIHDLLAYVPPLFDGKGQKPSDINLFLGYEQPTQTSTELQPGETQYKLHIYYGKTIDPTTFTATLNKQEISALFTPSPFTDEEVLLQLSTGRNVLVLSVDGESKTGKRQTDSDRLVFDVPE